MSRVDATQRSLTASGGAGGFALALALALAAPASGAERHHVLIVGRGSPELARKLRAEAAYAGFRPIDGARSGEVPATLRVLSRERVELSVEAADGDRHFEQTLVARAGEREAFALRVVEQLRARLVDVGWTPPNPTVPNPTVPNPTMPSEPTMPKAAAPLPSEPNLTDTSTSAALERGPESTPGDDRALVSNDDASSPASSAGRVWLNGLVMSSWANGGLGAMAHAALGVQLDLGAAWHARAASLWPLSEAKLEANEGEASVAWAGFSATLARSLPLPEPWLAQAGLGAGLLVIDARGEASAEFSGRRERLYAGLYFAELAFGRELASWLRLRASALGGLSAPRPVLRFDEREVASVGRFVGSVALGVELSWPRPTEAP